MKTYLTPLLLTNEGLISPALIQINDDKTIVVSQFSSETANTTFIPSPLAILQSEAITEFLLDDIQQILKTSESPACYHKLDTLFRSSNLYFNHLILSTPTILSLSATTPSPLPL